MQKNSGVIDLAIKISFSVKKYQTGQIRRRRENVGTILLVFILKNFIGYQKRYKSSLVTNKIKCQRAINSLYDIIFRPICQFKNKPSSKEEG